jgi:hypothetical protein
MNNYNIEYIFKYTKTPLLLLYILLNKTNFNDIDIENILKKFFLLNDILSIKINISCIINKNKYKNSYLLVNNYYNIINKQIKIIPFILRIKDVYPYNYFWSKDINTQIDYLKKKLNLFLSYYDCSKGNITFMIKLRMGYNNSLKVIENQMIDRLIKTKKLFKLHFFKKNKIVLMSLENFLNLTYENKINYIEYIFISCLKKILSYINYFELYNLYRMELINLLNTEKINVIESIDDIDFTISDIEF